MKSINGRSFARSVAIPSADTMCPRNATRFWQRWHFAGFSFSPAPLSLANTPLITEGHSYHDNVVEVYQTAGPFQTA